MFLKTNIRKHGHTEDELNEIAAVIYRRIEATQKEKKLISIIPKKYRIFRIIPFSFFPCTVKNSEDISYSISMILLSQML